MFSLTDYLDQQRRLLESALDQHMPPDTEQPALLHRAMRYCVFSDGKRIRPVLCLAAAHAIDADCESAVLPAIAIEALHTYTLVHDDLPAMDDDDLRRGRPTAHIEFGEANAILVGDALLTLAFEWLGQVPAPAPYAPGQLIVELAEAAGSRGVIGGQVEDLAASSDAASAELLDYIHLHKTAALIRASVRMGGIVAGANSAELDAFSTYGCDLGLAFQITDDILDAIGKTETIGKPVGSDEKNNKLTHVSVHGVDASRKRAAELIDKALTALDGITGYTEPLEAIARDILDRNH